MYEFAFVLLFSAAGAVAALLALRAGPATPAIRWLARLFLLALVVNLGLYLWPAVAADPGGTVRLGTVAGVLALVGWGYARMLRAARRAADGQPGGKDTGARPAGGGKGGVGRGGR